MFGFCPIAKLVGITGENNNADEHRYKNFEMPGTHPVSTTFLLWIYLWLQMKLRERIT